MPRITPEEMEEMIRTRKPPPDDGLARRLPVEPIPENYAPTPENAIKGGCGCKK